METIFIAAFVAGLISTVHCFGMCSGIVGALTLSLPSTIRERHNSSLPYLLAYNFGRIASYTVLGAAVGMLSHSMVEVLAPYYGTQIFHVLAITVIAAVALYIGGWFPKLAYVERIGRPIWRSLEPIGRRLLPVKSLPQAFLFGTIWGWLPCGLVYTMLLWTVTAGSALGGAGIMLGFGLGTLPAVVLAGLYVRHVVAYAKKPWVRQSAALMLLAMAVVDGYHFAHAPMEEEVTGEHVAHEHGILHIH